jgi:hypothetical protein
MEMADILPIVVLFIVAPISAELLTASITLENFFNPFVFLIFSALYGSGALLMRELKVRWGKGLISLLLLGLAFGLIEEGLFAKSLFTPVPEFGMWGEFARWMGINWFIAEMVIIDHTILSITIPVLLVEALFPWSKDKLWLGKIGILCLFALFVAVWPLTGLMVTGNPFWSSYNLPIGTYVLLILIIAVSVILARVLPSIGSHGSARGRTILFFIFGFVWTFIYWRIYFLLPWLFDIMNYPIIVLLSQIFWIFVLAMFIRHYDWDNRLHRLALVMGILSFNIFNVFPILPI